MVLINCQGPTLILLLGNRNEKDDQKSPIFLLFLDCVQQLMHQYPFAFEFNDKFLNDIAYHTQSCQFGSFLCNNYQVDTPILFDGYTLNRKLCCII